MHGYDAALPPWVLSLIESPDPTAAVPAALTAFLRGVERRGAVFAELQSGDSDAGDAALAAAMRAFRNAASAQPMAAWPRRFWTLLAATPQLRRDAPMARWATGLQALAELQPAPRQALLLRLAAGLEEEEAAAVSGLTQENYREALAQACPRDVQGQVDTTAWRQLAEAIQQHARDLAPERLDRLAQVRESAVSALRPERKVTPLRSAERTVLSQTTAGPRHLGWIVGVVVLCLLALAATWGWPRWQAWRSTQGDAAPGAGLVSEVADIRTTELPGQAPAATYDAAMALLAHPDFELVLDQQDEAVAREADFLAWLAVRQESVPVSAEASAGEVTAPNDSEETSDAQF